MNYGAVYEAVVTQELKTHGFELFDNNDKKRGEIDFLIEEDNKVIPLEVKGKTVYLPIYGIEFIQNTKNEGRKLVHLDISSLI